jgi:2-octaprenyl-6-methoxyphenol hydroxylase
MCDVAVVGGGLVGASFVLALARLDASKRLRVQQFEANAQAGDAQSGSDERHLALNAYSWQTLQQLGVDFDATRCSAIRRIHISSRGSFGRVLLDAEQEGVTEFGRLVPASHLRACLEQALQRCPSDWLNRLFSARVQQLEIDAESAQLTLADQTQMRASIIVGADGSESSVRTLMPRTTAQDDHFDYASSAISFNVLAEYEHAGCAFERFTEHGPIALLPLPNRRMGAIWTLPKAQAEQAVSAGESDFLAQFQSAFGYRLGRFSALGRRSLWPLQRLRAQPDVAARCVLIGNAAQTIHPLGAQGFNLGLRDALALAAEVYALIGKLNDASAVQSALQHFSATRRADREATLRFSDSTLIATQNATGLAKLTRGLTLLALDTTPLAKRTLTRFGLGFVR